MGIICVAGPYRTGKSYLLNRFAGTQKGFEIGPSTNPCTKGIWIWGEPIKISPDFHIVLMDTEGLGSFTRDEQIDVKLFTLSALLCSNLLYNVMGAITES